MLYSERKIVRWCCVGVCVLLLTGCVYLRDLPYRDQRKAADRAFDNREYVLAAARYEALRDRYPDTILREDIMFRQGMALYSVASYHDAYDVFVDYLAEYPRGRYLSDSKDCLKKIDVLMSRATPAEAKKLQAAKDNANLDVLNKLLVEHPTDWRVLEAIGDALWKLGNYDEAIASYYKAHSIASAYEERDLNNGKLVLDGNGKPIAVNPQILEQMEIERHPVRVYALHAYTTRGKTSRAGGDIQFYNLTGSVRNQGVRLLHNVEVEVLYKDLAGNILDVDYVSVGSLGPGEVRAFLSRADDYDNLYNIVDHEAEVHWHD
jgi:tetratricopeptide (TPR) repeat protein